METAEDESKDSKQVREAPAQLKKKEKINTLNSQISTMRSLQNSGLSMVSQKDMKNLIAEKEKTEKELKILKGKQKWAQKNRLERSDVLKKLR